MTRTTLLTVSGTIPSSLADDIAHGRRPRPDYLVMAEALDADLIDHPQARAGLGVVGRFVGRFAGDDVVLAWACFRRRRRYRVVFTDGEQVGMPYAALTWLTRRRPAHVMIGHRLSVGKKVLVHRSLRLQRRVERVVVYATPQQRCAIDRLGYPPQSVVLTPFMVDTEFWRPEHVPVDPGPRPKICAVGQERRDYPTMVAAVTDLDLDVAIAAISPWSKQADSSAGLAIPSNVTARGFDLFELRRLYAESALVVVPLEDTDFQAGITTILEAMAMGRAVVCTRTEGQTDTLTDDVTGVYVPPRDAAALRAAIVRLCTHPDEAARIGAAAQRWVRERADIEVYADRLAGVVRELAPAGTRDGGSS